jgi:MYXO-CTERM domain-containing protein
MRAEIVAAIGVAAVLSSANAAAFCRTTVVPVPADFSPRADSCWEMGPPLFHRSQCLPYRVQRRDSRLIPSAVLSDLARRAFRTWTAPNPTCTPGIDLIELAPIDVTDEDIAGYKQGGQPNANVIGVHDEEWPYNDASNTLALSTLTFDPETGVVLDADMEINGEERLISIGETPPADGYDLLSILTHEAGHFLGLAHSAESDATMYASYVPGATTMRGLSPDDHEGICWVYPSPFQRMAGSGLTPSTACQLAPGNPDGTCDPTITHGCSTQPGRTTGSLAGLFLLAALAFVRRRRQ